MQWMQHSSLNSSTFLRVLLKCFTHVSALALVVFLVFISPAAYCSTSTTNVVFYDDWVDYHDRIVEECNTIIGEAALLSSQLTIIENGLSASQRKISAAASAAVQFQFSDPDEYAVVRDALDDARDEVAAQQSTITDLQAELSDISSAAYRIQIDMPVLTPADFEGGGCCCPDYSAILNSIWSRLGDISAYCRDIRSYLEDLYFTVPNFIAGIDQGLGYSVDFEDLTNTGIEGGLLFGMIASNIWASASSGSYLHRTQRYSQYIDNDAPIDFEPEPNEVAADVPLVAIIGLLYRIQHKLYQTNVVDVVTGWREEEQQQIDEKEDEVEETSSDISLDDVPEMPSSAIPFSDLFHVFELLNTALDNILKNLPTIQIGTLIVVDSDGFDVNLGSGAATDINSRPLHFSPGPPTEGSSDLARGFIIFLSGLFAVVWYAIGGLVALLLSQWLFKLLVSAISLAFSVIGGDFSTAVRLLERFGSHFAGGS